MRRPCDRRKMIAPITPQVIAATGRLFVQSTTSEEDYLRQMMEEKMKGKKYETPGVTQAV